MPIFLLPPFSVLFSESDYLLTKALEFSLFHVIEVISCESVRTLFHMDEDHIGKQQSRQSFCLEKNSVQFPLGVVFRFLTRIVLILSANWKSCVFVDCGFWLTSQEQVRKYLIPGLSSRCTPGLKHLGSTRMLPFLALIPAFTSSPFLFVVF